MAKCLGLGIGLAALAVAVQPVQASRWIGGGNDGDWSNSSNWNSDYDGGSQPPANGNSLWFNGQSTATNHATFTSTSVVTGGTAGNLTVGNIYMYDTSYLAQTSGTLTTGLMDLADNPGNTSTFTLSGGTFTATGEFWVGGGGNGTLNMTGGTVNSSTYFVVGRSGTGVLNLSAGTVNASTAGGFATIGSFSGANGTLNVSGGTFSATGSGSGRGLIVGEGGTGTLNLSGSGSVITANNLGVEIGDNSNTSGTVNLNGGTLQTTNIYTGNASTTSTFNFNGGTLKAGAANATFMTGLTTANVRNGGAVINTNGFNITIGQALNHSAIVGDNATDGGLTKTGVGTLTLTSANTYTGPTTVNAGTLLINNSGSINSTASVQVATGGTLTLQTSDAISDTANLILAAGSTLLLNATGSNEVVGSLTLGSLTLGSIAVQPGTYTAADLALLGSGVTFSLPLNSSSFSSADGIGFLDSSSLETLTVNGVAPVPEAATWMAGALSMGMLAWTRRRQVQSWLRLPRAR